MKTPSCSQREIHGSYVCSDMTWLDLVRKQDGRNSEEVLEIRDRRSPQPYRPTGVCRGRHREVLRTAGLCLCLESLVLDELVKHVERNDGLVGRDLQERDNGKNNTKKPAVSVDALLSLR